MIMLFILEVNTITATWRQLYKISNKTKDKSKINVRNKT